jgi:hypothetical protein
MAKATKSVSDAAARAGDGAKAAATAVMSAFDAGRHAKEAADAALTTLQKAKATGAATQEAIAAAQRAQAQATRSTCRHDSADPGSGRRPAASDRISQEERTADG